MTAIALPFEDREAAGLALAEALRHYRGRDDVIVLALPRGGVPVGLAVATVLGVRLDLMLVRKLGTPGHAELAMGAIASGGGRVMNEDVLHALGISEAAIERVVERESAELIRREMAYRGHRPWPDLSGQCVILVDDGLATGATMRVSVETVRLQQPARIVVAVPVAPRGTVTLLLRQADEVVCLAQPEPFSAIGQWYQDFSQVTDNEVQAMLDLAWNPPA